MRPCTHARFATALGFWGVLGTMGCDGCSQGGPQSYGHSRQSRSHPGAGPASATISGRVYRDSNTRGWSAHFVPVTDFIVYIYPEAVPHDPAFDRILHVHDARGTFTVRNLSRGSYLLQARTHDGMAGATRGVDPLAAGDERSGWDIEVQTGGSMRGTVVDAQNGAPVDGAWVAFAQRQRRSYDIPPPEWVILPYFTRSASDGRFELSLVGRNAPADAISVSAPGFTEAVIPYDPSPTDGSTAGEVTVRMTAR